MTNNSNWIITSGTVNGYRAKQYAQLDNSGRPIKIDICIDINGDGINDFKIFRKDGSSSVFTAVARDGESYWEFANSQYDSFKSAPFIEAKKAPVPQPVAEEPQTVTTQTTSATPASVAQPQVQSEPQVVESQPKEEPQEEKKPKSINYTVKEGDSLSKIAGEHGISVAELRAANGIPPKSTAMQAIGYKEIVNYLDGKMSFTEASDLLKQNTRNYAKRQLTWFRKNNKINWNVYPETLKK